MLNHQVNKLLSLPELKFIKKKNLETHTIEFECIKFSPFEVCPKCATKSYKVYDHVYVHIKDVLIRNKTVYLKIKKRRFQCLKCKLVFREPVQGIIKGFRTTRRFRSHIRWCASNFTDLKRVMNKNKCSSWLVYKAFYEQLELEVRKMNNPWPKTIGVDEHSFVRNTKKRTKEFATIFVDYNNNRIREAVLGRSVDELEDSRVMKIEGRDNVKNVVMDMSSSYKKFAKAHFPKAIITVDKFHVVKLFNNVVNNMRIDVMKHPVFRKSKTTPLRWLYLTRKDKLEHHEKRIVSQINHLFPVLDEVYSFKKSMLSLYNIKGCKRAAKAYTKLTDAMALSKNKKVQSLRKTLVKWRAEILNYFRTRITNETESQARDSGGL